MIKRIALITLIASFTGCGDTSVVNVNLGSVSIGQQLMDLQDARKSGVIDEEEYQQTRRAILSIGELHEQASRDATGNE